MSDENGRPKTNVPAMPWEIWFRDFAFDFDPQDDGGMVVVFFPTAQAPHGVALMPPGLRIAFSGDGWRKFQARVAADGAPIPDILTAHVLPPRPPK